MRSSKSLHDKMFSGILNAPMRFFDSNPTGRILNRISTDMGLIDEVLPFILFDVVVILMVLCGVYIIIIFMNPTMMGVLFSTSILYYLIYKLFSRPLQDLKRLMGICEFIFAKIPIKNGSIYSNHYIFIFLNIHSFFTQAEVQSFHI